MRFMVIVPSSPESETGAMPNAEDLAKMGAFNEELVKAGLMLGGEGLHDSSKGARMTFGGKKPHVVDGPFTESKELIAGFWILQAKSKEEVVAWMSRAPFPPGVTLEIRQVHDAADFAPVDPTGELRANQEKLREQIAKRQAKE